MDRNFTQSGTFDLTGKTITFDDNNSSSDDTTLTCGSASLGSVVINKTNSGAVFTLGSSCAFSGGFTRTDGALNNPASAYTLTVNGTIAITNTTDTTSGSNFTLEVGGSGNQSINMGGETWTGKFNVNKSGGAATLAGAFVSSGAGTTCAIAEGTLALNGQTFTCGATFSVEDGGDLRMIGSETPTAPTLNSGSSVTFTGDGDSGADTYVITGFSATYDNLTINATDGTTDTFQLGTALTVNGTMNVSAGMWDFNAKNASITGNFMMDTAAQNVAT